MTNYKWTISALNCVAKEGQMTDVVSIIHWIRQAEINNIIVSVYGTMNCATPSETDFTAYPDLTYEQICEWLEAGLDISELDTNLNYQIDNIINPKIVNLPLPWTKNEIIEENEVILEPKTI
jgi:hypothetical protein